MEQATRNKLRNIVTQCRKLLEESIAQQLQGTFGIYLGKKDEVQIDDEDRLSLSSDDDKQYRRDLLDHFEHIKASSIKPKDTLDQLIREIAFTHLNRLCAYKMMEARDVYVGGQKFREAVGRGIKSNGFLMFLGTEGHEEDERLFNTGDQELAYRHFLDWLGSRLSEEIGVLFNPNDPANRLYPRQKTLDELLDLLNDEDLAGIWEQDETIGWVYQYFTPKELRDAARDTNQGGSQAPRNSYELAFRNQFFTPRYVVEFLTDNTLGRIWYEMRKGDTNLKDQCQYMVRRPNEIFLDEGQEPPESIEPQGDLSQEELLKQPVHISHRPKKDPRELKILDPASGSGHFLLYCFDLLLTIYEEAYDDPDLGPALQNDYPNLDDLRRDVPRLILAHNLHGIDIDVRATQIAALALWLRCQRAYQKMGLKKDRPKIKQSHFVCAEPMPGEEQMLTEFVDQLEPRLLGQLVAVVFDKMKLAGEAGSLLRIEDEIRQVVAEAKKQWMRETTQAVDRKGHTLLFTEAEMDRLQSEPIQASLFDISEITESQFFEQAERKVIEALRSYAESSHNGQRLQRQLFSDDAVRGFAFVDLCRQRFDVALMNPPFGEPSIPSKAILKTQYPNTKHDLYAAFVERGVLLLRGGGMLGAITSRTGFFLSSFQKWREELLLDAAYPTVFADLGHGVLDTAMVETAAYCLKAERTSYAPETRFLRLLHEDDKEAVLRNLVSDPSTPPNDLVFDATASSLRQVPGSPFAYWVSPTIRSLFNRLSPFESDKRVLRVGLQTSDDFRFVRTWWEVPPSQLLSGQEDDAPSDFLRKTFEGKRWAPFAKGGKYAPYHTDLKVVVNWENDGEEIRNFVNPTTGRPYSRPQNTEFYFRAGLTWPLRGIRLSTQAVPNGAIFSNAGKLATSDDIAELPLLLALTNSLPFDFLVGLFAGKVGGVQYEVGLLGRIPVPSCLNTNDVSVTSDALAAYRLRAQASTHDECSHLFVAPMVFNKDKMTLRDSCASAVKRVAADFESSSDVQSRIDDTMFKQYDLPTSDQDTIRSAITFQQGSGTDETDLSNDDEPDVVETDDLSAIADVISFAFGSAVGRWDVRWVDGDRQPPDLPAPFSPLPVCSPGMLQRPDGLPATEAPVGYPLRIDWDGIMVDDAGHQDDIVRRVREVLEVIWKDRADAIEKEACEILGVKTLRDYFRKPGKGGFWDDHVKRYSKSRRKAPIYWLLQSSKKNYAVWLYSHRLDKDMLFKALLNYVEPKIQREENRLGELRSQKSSTGDSSKEAKKIDRGIEKQEDLLTELRDFEEKLRKVADLHLVPNLNDGVVLNIAPLHELVPWKEAKKYWNELMDGKYEWSSIGKQLREKGMVK